MPPSLLSRLALVAALFADAIALALYRRALVRRGLRMPFSAVIGEATASFSSMTQVNGGEFLLWVRDLLMRQSDRALEAYRLVSLLLIVLTFAAMAWAAIA